MGSYKSAKEASTFTGIDYATICCVVNGIGKTAGGYIWKANTDTKNIQVGILNERLVESSTVFFGWGTFNCFSFS